MISSRLCRATYILGRLLVFTPDTDIVSLDTDQTDCTAFRRVPLSGLSSLQNCSPMSISGYVLTLRTLMLFHVSGTRTSSVSPQPTCVYELRHLASSIPPPLWYAYDAIRTRPNARYGTRYGTSYGTGIQHITAKCSSEVSVGTRPTKDCGNTSLSSVRSRIAPSCGTRTAGLVGLPS